MTPGRRGPVRRSGIMACATGPELRRSTGPQLLLAVRPPSSAVAFVLQALIEAEATEHIGADRYERAEGGVHHELIAAGDGVLVEAA